MLDVLLERTEAFLEQFSITRITMGDMIEFADSLGLDETRNKLQDIVLTIKVKGENLHSLTLNIGHINSTLRRTLSLIKSAILRVVLKK